MSRLRQGIWSCASLGVLRFPPSPHQRTLPFWRSDLSVTVRTNNITRHLICAQIWGSRMARSTKPGLARYLRRRSISMPTERQDGMMSGFSMRTRTLSTHESARQC
jgi:hypothetical protein